MTNMAVTCGDIQSSPIHSAYNYNNKILNYCYRSVIRTVSAIYGWSTEMRTLLVRRASIDAHQMQLHPVLWLRNRPHPPSCNVAGCHAN